MITMNNAALAAGASVVFTLSSSQLNGDARDVVVISPRFASIEATKYRFEVAYVGSDGTYGDVGIRVTNITAGSLAEAIEINYAIIKGAIS